MLKNLVKIANRLDSLGLSKEADVIDGLIQKMATNDWGDSYTSPMGEHRPYYHELHPEESVEREGDFSSMLTDLDEDSFDEDLQIDPETIIERSEMYSGEPSSPMGEHRPYMHELFPHPMKRRS